MFAGVLTEFMLRMGFGLACAMGITSSRQVTSGFFRVHLWVLMGFNTLAALVLASNSAPDSAHRGYLAAVVAAAILSYFGSVAWLYGQGLWGKLLIWSVAALNGWAAFGMAAGPSDAAVPAWSDAAVPAWLDAAGGGLLLGFSLAAMLLGHWYLNTPTMQLAPLKRLLMALFAAVAVRGLTECFSILEVKQLMEHPSTTYWSVVGLRWISGILGVLLLAIMTWQTLKIPNTQSATGILYVLVICVFLGELSSFWLGSYHVV